MPEKTKQELENAGTSPDHDELLSQQAGEEIDRLLAEGNAEGPLSELTEKELDDLFGRLNTESDAIRQQTESDLNRAKADGTPEEISAVQDSVNKANAEVASVQSETEKSAKEIMDSAPESVEGIEEVAPVSAEAPAVPEPLPEAPSLVSEFAADSISMTPPDESEKLATASGDLEVGAVESQPIAENSPAVQTAETPMTEAEALKQAEPSVKATRVESISQTNAAAENLENIVDDTKEDTREAPQELANAAEEFNNRPPEIKPKVENGKSYLDKLVDVIGNPKLTKNAINTVGLASYETLEDRRVREEREQQVESYNNVPRERTIYPKFLQEMMDNRAVNSFEESLKNNSNELAFLKGNIEKKGNRMAMIDDSLRENSEKIKLLSSDPILNPEERLKKQKEFEAKNKKLIAEQSDLKASIEGATQQYAWVKSQMDVAEKSRDLIVESVTIENEAVLGRLRNQELIDAKEISNLDERLRSERESIESLKADKAKPDIRQKTKDSIDSEIRAIKRVVWKLIDEKNKFERSAVEVRAKIHRLEANSKKFSDFSENKHSDRHESLDKEKDAKTGGPKPEAATTNASGSNESSASTDTNYETSSFSVDGTVEADTSEPQEEKQAFRTTPNPVAGYEVSETSNNDLPFLSGQKIENSVFSEAKKEVPTVPQTQNESLESQPVQASTETIKKPEKRKKPLISEVRIKLKKLGFDNKFIGQYTTLYKKTSWSKQAKIQFDKMKKEVDEKDRIIKEDGKNK